MNELLAQHTNWLTTHLALVYCAFSGAFVRLLLIRRESIIIRLENGVAGMVLALVLATPTANYFSAGEYGNGYAFFYGVVARELIVSFVDTFNNKALPIITQLLDSIPFLHPHQPKPPHQPNHKNNSIDTDSEVKQDESNRPN